MTTHEVTASPRDNLAWTVFKAITGSAILMLVLVIVYGLGLLVLALVPNFLLERFSPIFADGLRAVIASCLGAYAGARAVKFVYPAAPRRTIKWIYVAFATIGSMGWILSWIATGEHGPWEALINGVVSSLAVLAFFADDSWRDLPGRKSA